MVGRHRVGIGVRSSVVSAVATHGGTPIWHEAATIQTPNDLQNAVDGLLSQVPRQRWRRMDMVVAIGPSWSQTRRLIGLPASAEERTAELAVREGPGRFFLNRGAPQLVSQVIRARDGSLWASTFDGSVVDLLVKAAANRGIKLEAIVPTAAVLGLGVHDGEIIWVDGPSSVRLRFASNRLIEAGIPSREPRSSEIAFRGWPAELGDAGADFVDAYGAALCEIKTVPSLEGSTLSSPRRSVLRAAGAMAAALVAVMVIGCAPWIRAHLAEVKAHRQWTAIENVTDSLAQVHTDLLYYQSALTEFEALSGPEIPGTVSVLAAFARALPESTAATGLRLDSLGGQLVTLSPRIEAALIQLERSPAFTSTQIVGPITRELVGGVEWERGTIRFVYP